MISMLLYSDNTRELKAVLAMIRELACTESDERWEYIVCTDLKTLEAALSDRASYDIACIDLNSKGGTETAKIVRRSNPDGYIILISDRSISPDEYVRPSVLAGGLVIRPMTAQSLRAALEENIAACMKRFYGETQQASFVLDNREGRQLIPYQQISYFESREKKIILYTANEEFSFYDTLDSLEQQLPEQFIRCHRSFIVNRTMIDKIQLSQGLIILSEGEMIPVSRTYKAAVKELR